MIDANIIPISQMATHIAEGSARPLLPDGVPGPVHHRERWWVVPAGATGYEPVSDPSTVAMLARQADALSASAARLVAVVGVDAVRER